MTARAWNPFSVRRTAGQWVIDSVLFVVALIWWATTDFEFFAIDPWFRTVDSVLGLVAALAIWWTRAAPLATAIFLIVPGATSATAGWSALVGVYRVASLSSPRWSIPIVGVHLITAIPYHLVLPGMDWLLWLVLMVLLYGFAAALGLLARIRRLHTRSQVEHVQRELAEAQARLVDARKSERERIAREMHDVLAHRISLVAMHAGALEYRTSPGQTPPSQTEVHAAASVIRRTTHVAGEELREVLAVLRNTDEVGGATPPQPSLAALPALIAEATDAGQKVSVEIAELPELSAARQRTVYRVVQEALTNARKHASGAAVRVSVRHDDTRVTVEVVNGLPVGVTERELPGARAGLVGLAERVTVEGGRIEHGVVGGEFRIAASVPVGGTN